MSDYTILLIDYEPRSIERFRDPLVGAGYTVEIATDGVSGIEAFHRLSPDMVLVEAMIPKKHGFEVCQELKRTPHGRRTPVVITTGVYKGRKYRTQALHIYGCDEYIEKPIAAEQLLEIVGRFLGGAATAPSVRASEPAPIPSSTGGAPSFRAHEDTNAQASAPSEQAPAKPPRTTPTAQIGSDDGEAEIMARLDALIPTSGMSPAITDGSAQAVVAAVELMTATDEEDPLAQIRAELNAELNAEFGSLAVGPPVEPIPSDHAEPPSVLEALPVPDVVAAQPGRTVAVDTPRPRKAQQRPTPTPAPSDPERRTVPIWVWVGATIAASVGLYFFFMSSGGGAKRSDASPAPLAPPKSAEIGTTKPTLPPVESAPSASLSPAPAPTPEPESPKSSGTSHKLVLNAFKVPPTVAGKPGSAPKHVPLAAAPAPTAPEPVEAAPVATPPVAAAPVRPQQPQTPAPSVDENVAGVETLPDAADAGRPAKITPGALVPIDEADVLPISIVRKAPVYSIPARQLGLSGTVVMNVLINERGTVDQVVLVTGTSNRDANDSAIRAANSWTYRPATKQGVPVKVWRSEQIEVKP